MSNDDKLMTSLTLLKNYSKPKQPPPQPDRQLSLECLDTDFVIEILNSVEDKTVSSSDSRDDDIEDFSDLILLEAEDVEEVNLLQIAETGEEHSGDHHGISESQRFIPMHF